MENRWSNTIQSADTTLLLVSWTSCKCNYIKTKVINNNIYLLIRVFQYRTKKLKKNYRSKGYVKCILEFLHILFHHGDKPSDSGTSDEPTF